MQSCQSRYYAPLKSDVVTAREQILLFLKLNSLLEDAALSRHLVVIAVTKAEAGEIYTYRAAGVRIEMDLRESVKVGFLLEAPFPWRSGFLVVNRRKN